MKVMTILGTRPEIIRLSRLIERLDHVCKHVLVHTGQNFSPSLSQFFFNELKVRPPDHDFQARGNLGEQLGGILANTHRILEREQPDRFLVLGDTNSALSAIAAKRMGIPVFHMEAGNRCHDHKVPEEVNRRLVDHCSDVLLPYTERSRDNLLREGIPSRSIYVTGNPIYEVLMHYEDSIDASDILERLGLADGKFFLATIHRGENVDSALRLKGLLQALTRVAEIWKLPVIVSTHPHTRDRMESMGRLPDQGLVRFLEPFGFFDFVQLEKRALCVLSDSGTVQEECAIFGKPQVIVRDSTERPETLESGASLLAGVEPDGIVDCVRTVLASSASFAPPAEYLAENVSEKVVKIILGHLPALHGKMD